MKKLPALLLACTIVLQASNQQAHAVSCEDEFGRRECRNGVVTDIVVDPATIVTFTSPPYLNLNGTYDKWKEKNCCSPNRTRTLETTRTTVRVGSVSFEVDAAKLFSLLLPAGYSLDGGVLKLNGSHTVTVEAANSDAIELPQCSQVDVSFGAAYIRTTRVYEGQKTCAKVYAPVYPSTTPIVVECGTFLDLCAETLETKDADYYLEFEIPVSPTTLACPGISPNPCGDPQNPICAG